MGNHLGNCDVCHLFSTVENEENKTQSFTNTATPQILKDPSAVKKCIYIDWQLDWNKPELTIRQAADVGFNVILLAFYLENQPADAALAWQGLSDATKIDTINYLHSKNAILLISAGGSTVIPYTLDPASWATQVCQYAQQNYLDGVDLDAEGIDKGFQYAGMPLYNWFNTFFNTTHAHLGSDKYITSAPQAPYICVPGISGWCGPLGGFTRIMQDCPFIDFLMIQFYNQGETNYRTYDTVWIQSTDDFPYSAIEQLNSGTPTVMPFYKLVFGTYLTSGDGKFGISDPYQIRDCFAQAQSQLGWNAGSMVWMWRTDGSSPTPQQWYDIIYGGASASTNTKVLATKKTKKKKTKKKRRKRY